jgi:hypothetical protein
VPTNWKDPQGAAADHYSKAFKPAEKAGIPAIPPLFQPATLNKYHTDTQKMHVAKIGGFMDKMCDAIQGALDQWQKAATMTGVMITGPVASMGVIPPMPLMPLIMASAPKETPQLLKFSTTIATVISNAWMQFTTSIKIPGLPLFPAFAMFPGPMAPPMPSLPVPFAALTKVDMPIKCSTMKPMMVAQHGDPTAPYAENIFEAICDGFEKVYMIWMAATQVMNIQGFGPIPTFLPPFVPAGPVVGGTGMMAPGGFMTMPVPPVPVPPLGEAPQLPQSEGANNA